MGNNCCREDFLKEL